MFDGYRAALADNRAQLYLDIPTGPFYSFNRTGRAPIEGLIRNWWRQGMMGSVKAGYECVKAFSETDFTEDLKSIEVPVLVIHSEDDQVVPYADSGPLAVQAAEERQAQDLQGPAARLPFDPSGSDQCATSSPSPTATSAAEAAKTHPLSSLSRFRSLEADRRAACRRPGGLRGEI